MMRTRSRKLCAPIAAQLPNGIPSMLSTNGAVRFCARQQRPRTADALPKITRTQSLPSETFTLVLAMFCARFTF